MQTENNQAKESLQNSPLITQNVNSTDTVYQSLKTEIQNENISDLTSILKDIPLNNLNDYCSIETSIFKKRIEKLNLQFFWIYESILQGQNINMNNSKDNTNNINSNTKLIFPYNKLFLILFKDCIKSLIFKTGHYYPKELFNYFLKNNYDNILKLNGNNHIDSVSSIFGFIAFIRKK